MRLKMRRVRERVEVRGVRDRGVEEERERERESGRGGDREVFGVI